MSVPIKTSLAPEKAGEKRLHPWHEKHIEDLRAVIEGQQELLEVAMALLACMAVRAGSAAGAVEGGEPLQIPKREVSEALYRYAVSVGEDENNYRIGFTRSAEATDGGARQAQ